MVRKKSSLKSKPAAKCCSKKKVWLISGITIAVLLLAGVLYSQKEALFGEAVQFKKPASINALSEFPNGELIETKINCGEVIRRNTILTKDLVCEEGASGLYIPDFPVSLKCNGYKIIGKGGNFGIQIHPLDGTISNCDVSGFKTGVKVTPDPLASGSGGKVVITDNKLHDNSEKGLSLEGLGDHQVVLQRNEILRNGFATKIDLFCSNSFKVDGQTTLSTYKNENCAGSFFTSLQPPLKQKTVSLPLRK